MITLGFFRPDERAELIHGAVLSMSLIGAPDANVVRALGAFLTLKLGHRALVSVQLPFVARDDSEPQPDIAIVPLGDYAQRHPDRAHLLVEVADTSLDFDREVKGPLYAASDVSEYWLVDVNAKAVEVYTEPKDGRYARMHRVTDPAARLPLAAFADVEVRVRDVLGG